MSVDRQALSEARSASCKHCGLPVPDDFRSEFCCTGCQAVYQTIHELGLDDFYRLRAREDVSGVKAEGIENSYRYLDDPLFSQEYVVQLESGLAQVTLFLEGIHCAACVWLLERLPALCDGLHSARVDFADSSIDLEYYPERVPLSELAHRIATLGYLPHPERGRKQKARTELTRLGIAGMCAGNTMMIAVSLYEGAFSGIAEKHESFLAVISAIVAAPAVLYSAIPFYQAALAGLRARMLHIDLPLSIAMLGGFLLSCVNVYRGSSAIYFDSICMLIFLLLAARYVQRRGLDDAARSGSLHSSFLPYTARKQTGQGEEQVYIDGIQPGDTVVVRSGEVFPVDGIVSEGSSEIDCAALTGESKLKHATISDKIFAGTRNIGSTVEVLVGAARDQSRLGRLIAGVERTENAKPRFVQLTDRLSVYFVAVILGATSVCGLWLFLTGRPEEALERMLALLVVSCPCALGLSAPIVVYLFSKRAQAAGVLLRRADVFERILRVKQVLLDKTGTLTTQNMVVAKRLDFDGEQFGPASSSLDEIDQMAAQLERDVEHPIADALKRLVRLDQYKDFERQPIAGKGIRAKLSDSEEWFVGSPSYLFANDSHEWNEVLEVAGGITTPVIVVRNGKLIRLYLLTAELRAGATELLSALEKRSLTTHLLSGDTKALTRALGLELGIEAENIHAELSPEEKLEYVEQQAEPTLMIGDGANDAAALIASDVGVAVSGGAEVSMKAADVFLATGSLDSLVELLRAAQVSVRRIKLNLCISVIYNIVGVGGAALGYVSPLVAAILMPLSSLTVVISSLSLRTRIFNS